METITNTQLELEAEYDIDVIEPSGLAINSSKNVLYTVSDHTNKVYKLSMKGKVLQSFNYEGNDLEGVSMYKEGKLLLADERLKNIVELEMSTGGTKTHHINYDNEQSNAGIEGVTYNSKTKTIYIVNEKNPDKLFHLNDNFKVINNYDLDFANDYSGLFYEASTEVLWILSDESQSIYKCDIKGKMLSSYVITIHKPEGIAVTDNKIYIVSDSQEQLYVYKKPK